MHRVLRFFIVAAILALVFLIPSSLFEDNITIVGVNNKTSKVSGIGFFRDEKNILTAAHIVEPNGEKAIIGEIEILDEAGHLHPAKVVGVDTDSDIAILNMTDKCSVKPRPACPRILKGKDLGSREVFYSKNYGYSRLSPLFDVMFKHPTYLRGELLGPEWNIGKPGVSYIKHDSAIVHGYSGGPLVDANDCYVGMNVTVEVYRPKLSHAVSLETIEEVVPELIKSGRVDMPFLGIIFEQTLSGVFISGAIENSPAAMLAKYGVRILSNSNRVETYPAYELVSINDKKVERLDKIWDILKSLPSGSTVSITMKDSSGKIELVKVISGERFSMIRKYIPNVRYLHTSHSLLV